MSNYYLRVIPSVLALAAGEEKKIPCTQQLKFYKGAWENRTTEKPGRELQNGNDCSVLCVCVSSF